ncbi:hypothetical protein Smp_193620 [Schistosoma mansoni]|uniref:hypothetical protein n=1 Tax=Schistosoma mansoni TaxID=6183 RepID=UPI00022DC3AA|nr:hypothetical protein Smp_193620 [Schistosoma mansoni]|eukprot:XP_018653760.1 hypothetical protein Smp_193620 [Schistosoma mansoni]
MDFSKCHASKCAVITDMNRWREADALILTEDKVPKGTRPPEQLWFSLIQESPVHIAMAGFLENEVSNYGHNNITYLCHFNSFNHQCLPLNIM